MNPGELNVWLDIVIQVLALVAAIVGGLWAYTRFIVERGLLPPVEFTFVRPGVNQTYTLVTTLPDSATFVVVKGQFRYAQRPSTLQLAVIKLSRRLGLTHYSLDHVTQPHTVERAFALADEGEVSP